MSDMLQNQLSNRAFSGAGLGKGPGGFAWLSRNRQVLVFQTIEDALSASPPRPDATFDNVVAAYDAVTNTVYAANNGSFSDATLADLEQSIRAAGGLIAPGLRSQGEQSVSSFRSASFGELGNRYDSVVVDAIERSLSVYLKSLEIDDLGRVFDAVASFLNPVLNGEDNQSTYEAFRQFDNSVKANIFLTIEDALISSPPRLEANFETIVNAFSTERQLLESSWMGSFSENLLKRYESAIGAAGGKLYPATLSHGESSISAYRKQVFESVNAVLSDDVRSSAEFCLNGILKRLKPTDLVSLLRCIQTFYAPLTPGSWDSPSFKVFNGFSEPRKVLVFKTLELIASHSGDYGQVAFQKAVKAAAAELSVLEAASFGQLNADVLGDLLEAIVDCGGSVAGGLSAYGAGSVGELLDVFYVYAVKVLPQEVFLAANSALNARLRTLSSGSVLEVLASAKGFIMPLISTLKQTDLAFKQSEPQSFQSDPVGVNELPAALSDMNALSSPALGPVEESQPDQVQHDQHEEAVSSVDVSEVSAEPTNGGEHQPIHLPEPAAPDIHAMSAELSDSLSVNLVAGGAEDGYADDKKKAMYP